MTHNATKDSTDARNLYAPRLGAIVTGHIVKTDQSINFVHPFSDAQVVEMFEKVGPSLRLTGPGHVIMWVARLPNDSVIEPLSSVDMKGNETGYPDIVGTLQLAFHMSPNGVHRSEVRKLIVDERYQGRGIARILMEELHKEAKAGGSTLCVSTSTYLSFHGWLTVMIAS